MVEGVDYSWARPDPKCLFNAGKRFAVRYVEHRDPAVDLTRSEADRLRAAGLSLVVVHQRSQRFMTEGYDAGYKAARDSHAAAIAAGMPASRPIYFSLDTDPSSLSALQWGQVVQFLLGAGLALGGPQRVGVYGGWDAIERLVTPARARWGWQTVAWSGGRWNPKAHIRQGRYGQPNLALNIQLCGGNVDLDAAVTTDFGQWR